MLSDICTVHLFIMSDDVWLWLRFRDRQGKHRAKKYCMSPVVAKGQRDALPWTDVTLSTSYNKCHKWMSSWTSPMNKCRPTGHRKHAFPDPSVIIFSMLWYVPRYYHLSRYCTLFFRRYEQVYRTQKVCVSGPMFIGNFSCFDRYYHLSKYSTLF